MTGIVNSVRSRFAYRALAVRADLVKVDLTYKIERFWLGWAICTLKPSAHDPLVAIIAPTPVVHGITWGRGPWRSNSRSRPRVAAPYCPTSVDGLVGWRWRSRPGMSVGRQDCRVLLEPSIACAATDCRYFAVGEWHGYLASAESKFGNADAYLHHDVIGRMPRAVWSFNSRSLALVTKIPESSAPLKRTGFQPLRRTTMGRLRSESVVQRYPSDSWQVSHNLELTMSWTHLWQKAPG